MSSAGPGGGDIFDVKKVRRLVELMKEHDLAEIDLRQADQRIRLRRGAEPQIATGGMAPMNAPAATSHTPATPPSPTDSGFEVIKSPMVGTFYAAGNPESTPFVKVGDHVGPESVVCIIEAMKVFNEIRAETSGTIEKILVKNAQAVEFGQALFAVRPD
jgi:acetyl-CoA carboxylase biotin carboxyl carrier protein